MIRDEDSKAAYDIIWLYRCRVSDNGYQPAGAKAEARALRRKGSLREFYGERTDGERERSECIELAKERQRLLLHDDGYRLRDTHSARGLCDAARESLRALRDAPATLLATIEQRVRSSLADIQSHIRAQGRGGPHPTPLKSPKRTPPPPAGEKY